MSRALYLSGSMHCPRCNVNLVSVDTVSHYGLSIVLDQCPQCSGVWVDPDEVFRRSLAESATLRAIAAVQVPPQGDIHEARVCPKDGGALTLFTDANWPEDIPVQSCGQCGGFWFTGGELARFDTHRRQLREAQRNAPQPTKKELSQKEKEARARVRLMLHAQLAHPQEDFGAKVLRTLSTLPIYAQTSLLLNTILSLLAHIGPRVADFLEASYQHERREKIDGIMQAFDEALLEKDTNNMA